MSKVRHHYTRDRAAGREADHPEGERSHKESTGKGRTTTIETERKKAYKNMIALKYVEYPARTKENLKDVFDETISASLRPTHPRDVDGPRSR